jgi:UDP-N-acetylmuramoyl-tripeptide--D-alanyl-D-alanine ligase
MNQADIIEFLFGKRPEHAGVSYSTAVVDSRKAVPGSIFFAVPGENTDGHLFIEDAFSRRAKLAIVQNPIQVSLPIIDARDRDISQFSMAVEQNGSFCILVEDSISTLQSLAKFWRQRIKARVIGITGSVGKSTTKEVTSEVLSQKFRTLKNPGNLNNEIGLPLTLLGLQEEHQRAVLEMGFYVPGEISFLCDIAAPVVGVITNIGTVHAERAGSQEAIARGKAELVQALPAAPEGVAILNFDDPLVRDMSDQTQAKVFYYGLDPEAELWADNVESDGLNGIKFRLHYENEIQHVHVPMIGRHSVHTVLRAAAVGLVEGLNWQQIFDGLISGKAQLRLVVGESKSGALIIDDTYNASPQSMMAALNLLEELDGRKIAVLGDMLELGPYEKQGHYMVGVRAAEVADELITVGELARLIANSARKTGFPEELITELKDTDDAIDYLGERLGKNDVVLIKGSHGMRMDRITANLEVDR